MICSTPNTYGQKDFGSVMGVISDPTGAVVLEANVTVTDRDGNRQTVLSNDQGRYRYERLIPGPYVLMVTAPGFSNTEGISIEVIAGRILTRNVSLQIASIEQQVNVTAGDIVDVEPTTNASSVSLSGTALQTLSDDQDDLAQDLSLLAGPSTGPRAGEIFVDGFSGAKLPPKSAIREVRINQNPFSAEYDRLGYGRIEVLTKPGSDKYHGDVRFNIGDSALNSRNPFAPLKPDYQRRTIEGTFRGPLGQSSSFTFQVERRDIGQAAVVNALVLDSSLNVVPYRQSVIDPRTNTEVTSRIDHQISQNHTLIARYEWEKNIQTNAGLNSFTLPTRAQDTDEREHVFQLTETAIITPGAINELKLQYRRSHDTNRAVNAEPTVVIPGAFTSGGSSMDLKGLLENRYELQDLLSVSHGKHLFKFGGRLRAISESNSSAEDYNGAFTFASLDTYRATIAGLRAGLSPAQIRAAGGGASQFAISSGNPIANLKQLDAGLFAQDDWRLRKDLTISAGIRYEGQTNIPDVHAWAPRFGLAYAIPGKSPDRPFGILRAGFGLFYDRVQESLVLDSRRLNGSHQKKYVIANPEFYPSIPDEKTLSGFALDQAIRKLDSGVRAPRTRQFAFSLERQFPMNTSMSISYMLSRGDNMLRSRNINAPIEQTGLRPAPGGNVYAYESSGRYSQHQAILNINARLSDRYSLFAYYTWNSARSDTDGADTFPASSLNLSGEYSRAQFDVRHRTMLGGTLTAPLGFVFNPFVVMHSGEPFNITVGRDLNGDSIFNDRPAWTNQIARPSVVQTKWGSFDTDPIDGQIRIPRNLGSGPGMLAFNVRLSKAFGMGKTAASTHLSSQPGWSGPGSGSHYHGSDAVAEGSRYSLTLSIAARNVLNTVNLDSPVGNLSSPLFGSSTSIHGVGPGSASANRTVDLQLRFSF